MTDGETYSLREVERDYRVHRNTLRRAISEGRLRATKSNEELYRASCTTPLYHLYYVR